MEVNMDVLLKQRPRGIIITFVVKMKTIKGNNEKKNNDGNR